MHRQTASFVLFISMAFTGGCATMNQSECQTADWSIIGMRDGSAGKLVSYIDNHRKSCAKYGVAPDLSSYSSGHARGVAQYCSPRNGYAIGRSGNSYNGVCPPEQEEEFLDAYSLGQDIYQSNKRIRAIDAAIRSKNKEIYNIGASKHEKEQLLIYGELTPAERAGLLNEIKDMENAVAPIEEEIYVLEEKKKAEEINITELNSLNIWQ